LGEEPVISSLAERQQLENTMKKSNILFTTVLILFFNSIVNAELKELSPGTYENWNRRINKLEIIKSFKLTDYSQIVIKDVDTSNIQYQLLNFPEDRKTKLVKDGSYILLYNINNNPNKMEVIKEIGSKSNKSIILNISIKSVGVEQKTVWWYPLAWVEINGEITDSQTNEVILKFETRRTTSAKGIYDAKLPEKLDDKEMNAIIEAIITDFKEIGVDLNVLIFSFK
jgi:hypothetical protein